MAGIPVAQASARLRVLSRQLARPCRRTYHSASEVHVSEQGWREFLSAEDVADCVVLHGGAMAVFRVLSLVEAARPAGAVSCVCGLTAQAS